VQHDIEPIIGAKQIFSSMNRGIDEEIKTETDLYALIEQMFSKLP